MAKNKLNNLLSFKNYDSLKTYKKATKRTGIGGDIINEHHKDTVSGKKSYIKSSLKDISDGLVTKIYNLIEGELE